MPFRVFAAGEVLTAANVNDYLAEQAISTFAGTAARASAITAPTEGQFAYLSDSDSLTFYNGSAWVNAGSAIAGTALSSGTATSGQVLTANGSGAVTFSTPTQGLTLLNTTSFTAVSSQSITQFSANYENYRVILKINSHNTTNGNHNLRMRSGSTDASGSNYYVGGYFNYANAATTSYFAQNAQAQINFGSGTTAASNMFYIFDFINPFLTVKTGISCMVFAENSTYAYGGFLNASHDLANSYDGFSIIAAAGSITGKVTTFGYNF